MEVITQLSLLKLEIYNENNLVSIPDKTYYLVLKLLISTKQTFYHVF